MDELTRRVRRAVAEPIEVVEYDPEWPERFEAEKTHLLEALPDGLVTWIEHFGSTAVPGLAAKPVIDILVGVRSLAEVQGVVVPLLESEGYEYFWRPTFGDDVGPFYAFFIRRDVSTGARTHHVHMVEESGFDEHWERVGFRDLLLEDPGLAAEYAALKRRLAGRQGVDRVSYTEGKSKFISAAISSAKQRHGW